LLVKSVKIVKFNEGVIERTKHTMRHVKERESELQPRTITVRLTKHDNFLSEASQEGSAVVWYTDESRERGGQEKGSSPLSYFLSSMGFCQFVHYAEHSDWGGIVQNVSD
jgi:hypothetical protein